MNEIIIEAIKNKKIIECTYKDELRVVEPYTYGLSSKDNDILRVYQIDGGSTSSDKLGWRLLTVDKMININVLDDDFIADRDDYNPEDKAMTTIYITA